MPLGPEISDVVVDYDPATLARRPVRPEDALAKLVGPGSAYARRVVRGLPVVDGALDPRAVDAALVRAHSEMQRLWEEFFHGPRVARVLTGIVGALPARERPYRVVDVGCGPGFVLRWLAAHRVLEGRVEWVGADYNAALITRARRLAAAEDLPVRFVVANAFTLEEPADIFMSSGVLHHFRGDDLGRFFAAQAISAPTAFAHFDIQASWATPIGSFLFHAARMREPLARYDGWLSAVRAHPGPVLEGAARPHRGRLRLARYHPPIVALPVVRTLTGVLAVPAEIADDFAASAGEPLRWID